MGRLRDLWSLIDPPSPVAADSPPKSAPTFAIGPDEIPPEFFGLQSYEDHAAKVPRRTALQVPAVKRSRDLIAGVLGSLPMDMLGPDNAVVTVGGTTPSIDLLLQPERGIPRSVTLARTFEDLLFEGVAWWLVTEYDWRGFPYKVVRLDSGVDIQKQARQYQTKVGHHGSATRYDDDFDIIRIDSPNEGILIAGARAIRACLSLDSAAATYAAGNMPLDYFTPADGVDPDQTDLDNFMDSWDAARRSKATGYVPGTLAYHANSFNPEQLQMAEARQHAVLEIARLCGIDPEDLGVSTTSRTYQNSQDRYQSRIKDTYRGYAVALEERLSMPDVTPRGYKVQMNFTDLTRADDLARFNAYEIGLRVGAYADKDEVRDAEGKPPADFPEPAPAPATAESSAPAGEEENADVATD